METGRPFKLCPNLPPKTKCIRLAKYSGRCTVLYHEHFPAHRISHDASIEMMKALVLTHEQFAARHILRCYLNKRGSEPESCDPFQIRLAYPEPGVFRTPVQDLV